MTVLATVKEVLGAIWSFDGVKFIIVHVVFNVAVAVAAALKTKTFSLSKLADFLISKLLPYVTVYMAVKLFGAEIGFAALAPVTWAVITATLLGDLGDSLAQLGVQLPEAIRQFVVKGLNLKG